MNRKTPNILLIDDDESLCTVVSHQLEKMGYRVTTANSGQAGLDAFHRKTFDLLLLDLQMPDMHGLEVLQRIRQEDEQVPIIIITAYGTIENAVDACRRGADDYLPKPFAKEQLRFTIEKVLRFKELERDNRLLRRELEEKFQFGSIVSKSKVMKTLLEIAGRAAGSDATVLITGESGTGKELLAKAIHHSSPRKDKPFIAVNCPSIPESLIESELFGHEKGAFTGAVKARPGKFELASGGTLFLDEVGDLKLDLQAKLLRVLQEHEIERIGGTTTIPVDVRILSATNQDLLELVREGRFRQDLYYRLNVIPLHIPPLRERREDIPLLAEHFVKKYAGEPKKMTPGFLQMLMEYDWPGNVRELENVIQRAVVLCTGEELTRECLAFHDQPRAFPSTSGSPTSLADVEREAIVAALESAHGNQTRAAELLNIPRHVLLYRMKKLNIKAKEK